MVVGLWIGPAVEIGKKNRVIRRIIGPSNGKGLNLYSKGRGLKIASFEGSMILQGAKEI